MMAEILRSMCVTQRPMKTADRQQRGDQDREGQCEALVHEEEQHEHQHSCGSKQHQQRPKGDLLLLIEPTQLVRHTRRHRAGLCQRRFDVSDGRPHVALMRAVTATICRRFS